MQLILNATRLETGFVNDEAAEILETAVDGNALGGNVTIIGNRVERLAFLAEWLHAELVAANMYDSETLAAVRPVLVAFQEALGVDIEIA